MDGRENQLRELDKATKDPRLPKHARAEAAKAIYKIKEQQKDSNINKYREALVDAAKRGDQAEVANISMDIKKYEGDRLSIEEIDL